MEPHFRASVLRIEGPPLEEGAYAITIFAYAVHQLLPARLIGGVRPIPVVADAEEEDANRSRSAVCPLLT